MVQRSHLTVDRGEAGQHGRSFSLRFSRRTAPRPSSEPTSVKWSTLGLGIHLWRCGVERNEGGLWDLKNSSQYGAPTPPAHLLRSRHSHRVLTAGGRSPRSISEINGER